jgi:hypothetical protein
MSKFDLASIEARLFSAFMEILMDESYFADRYREDDNFNVYVLVLQRCAGEPKATKKHELYTPYKHGVLGKLYGSGPKRFSAQLRNDFDLHYTVDECVDIHKSISTEFPFVPRFQKLCQRIAEEQGYIMDMYGTEYQIPEQDAYKTVNTLCQGCAGMVLKDWWGRLEKERTKQGKIDLLFNTVHDELDVLMSKAKGKRHAQKRAKAYCDCAREIDRFGLPIVADDEKGLVDTWGSAG